MQLRLSIKTVLMQKADDIFYQNVFEKTKSPTLIITIIINALAETLFIGK